MTIENNMSFHILCKSLETRVAKELVSALSGDDKVLVLTSALFEYGNSVLKELNTLCQGAGEGSPQYMQARTAAVELLTFLALPMIRYCVTFKQGVTVFEEIAGNCSDEEIRRRLVIYSNQLKKRWNQADPSALPINPRAAKPRPQGNDRSMVVGAIKGVLLLVLVFYLFSRFFPDSGTSEPQRAPQQPAQERREEPVASPVPQKAQVQTTMDASPANQGTPGEDFYSYTDDQGVVHIVSNIEKVPMQYRQSVTVTRLKSARSEFTTVMIRGNQVIVPVTLSYRGRSVDAVFLLDTGCTVSAISEQLAARLGVDPSDTQLSKSTVADGRTLVSRIFIADSLNVGTRSVSQTLVSILPGSGNAGFDGFLGMNFLKNYRYHIDFSRSVIEWGG